MRMMAKTLFSITIHSVDTFFRKISDQECEDIDECDDPDPLKYCAADENCVNTKPEIQSFFEYLNFLENYHFIIFERKL